jgi:hypothetical protein
MPRSVEIIKEQIEDLDDILSSVNYEIEFDSPTKAFINSMKYQRTRLDDELKAAEWLETQSDIELVLDGSSIVEHSLPVNILGKLLDQVQKLFFATAEIADGAINSRGRFQNNIIKNNKLMVKCFIPSSFAIHFTYANELITSTLFDNTNERPGEKIFLSLLSGDTDIDELNASLISPRIHNYYNDFLSFLAENDLTIRTRTKNHPYSVVITPEKVKERKEFFDYTFSEPKEEEISIEGILVMGDIKNNSFAINVESTIYRGQVSEEGVIGLKKFPLGSKVQANILVTAVNEDVGQPNYTLLSLKDLK